jgi:hypothetical protein
MPKQASSTNPADAEDPDYREWKQDIESRKQKILKAPAVGANLKKLANDGADPDKLLLGLAIVSSQECKEIHRQAQGSKKALRRLAQRLEAVSSELDRTFSSPFSFSAAWKVLLFPFADTEFPDTLRLKELPAGLIRRMRSAASALRSEEHKLGGLIRLHPRLTNTFYLAGIVRYVKESTGSPHDKELADLLQAAHNAFGSEKQFSAESLKKFRQRHVRTT